ncbi:MAG: hypothetical protein L0H59_18765 [Tomitella sp.]|nr:hypothetical protein [Tomitella sp.]
MSDQVSKSVRRFIADHGGSAKAVLQPVGRRGVRVTLVGDDGVMGDQMVDSMAEAEALIEAVPDLTASDWDRELVSAAAPREGHMHQMAGWSGRGL